MKKKFGLLIGLLILCAVLGTNVYLLSEEQAAVEDEEIEIITAQEETLYETIISSAVVEPQNEVEIFAEMEYGEIEEIHVEEGDFVEEGDLLVSYINEELSRQIVQMENSLDRAMLQMEQQNDQIQQLETAIANAENDEEPDQVIEQYERELDDLQFQRRMTNQEYSEQEEELEYYMEQEQHDVHSDIVGYVHIKNEPSEVSEGEPLLHIISDTGWDINGTVTEYDLVRLEEGLDVRVAAKVFADQEWEGELTNLGTTPAGSEDPLAVGEENVTSYPFTVRLNEETEELQHGFHVDVFMDIEAAAEAVVIPYDVIQTDVDLQSGEEESFVYTLENNIVVKRVVDTGISNEQGVQILAGVTVGDEILVPDAENPVHEGMEVGVHDPAE